MQAPTAPPARRGRGGQTVPPRPLPAITFPDDLPVSARRDEIARAIQAHPVVIVCGETGSGKTTQLPKLCLSLGRGQAGSIGHTQPRRLAATSVAKRIAEELNTELGDWVGYQIRFSDRSGPGTAIKLMTDGILLAQTQRDPLLRAYDTIIIDEAHERSLNIDFLLGFLRQLLPRRPDLKVIITSATIDAERFAAFFAQKGKPAPVIEVSGRTYPVEVRWRPIRRERDEAGGGSVGRDEDRDLMDGIVDAVDECERHGPGDVLVFLPGEREIRDAAQALRKVQPATVQVLPLFARLSQADQEQIFRPRGQGRRIVLATNVAETSLTVPGIRYVVDSGLARVKRYSWRNKVEQLRVEPISQAAARQRAGRCGRVGPGVCIRLYDEPDHQQRPAFTDPEILRSSLASVILRMRALRLQDIEEFPFLDAPHGRAIADGYQTLQELGALDAERVLTRTGSDLARLPVDPRLGRMILSAREYQCLAEILIIVAGLSVQDPRERPLNEREAAETAQARFANERSEFLSWVTMWQWVEGLRDEGLSQRKQAEQARRHYLSPSRLREWRDVHSQLSALAKEQGWRPNTEPPTDEQLHMALLAGLLGQVGCRDEDGSSYQGVRDIRFLIHPGSRLARKAGKWIVAGELVQTTKLYARCVARIEPPWLERAAAHLLKRTWSDPRWEKKAGQVVANERATLYGLMVYSGRRVHYGRIDPVQAREIFLRDGLVAGDVEADWPFLQHNRRLVADIERLEHRSRRQDILVDDALIYAFYDRHVPAEVCQTATLDKWLRGLSPEQQAALKLSRDDLMRHDAAGVTTDVFPKHVTWQGVKLALDYHFEPGSVRDGVTMTVPLYALNRIDPQRCEWLVPGMLKEKVHQLVKSLPQKIRRHCVPLPDYAQGFFDRWYERAADPTMGLVEAIIQDMWEQVRQRPVVTDFKLENLPAHLFMNFRVVDEHGRMLSGGRNLDQLKAEHGRDAQQSFQQLAAKDAKAAVPMADEKITAWTFGELPELMEIKRGKQSLVGYPALADKQTHCELDVYDDPAEARRVHLGGLRRLCRLALREAVRFLEKQIDANTALGLRYMNLGTAQVLRDQIIDSAIEQACLADPLPQDEAAFAQRLQEGRTRLGLLAQEMTRYADEVLGLWQQVQKKLRDVRAHEAAHADMQRQLSALVGAQFLRDTPVSRLRHVPRYLQGILMRMDKLRKDPPRDARLMSEMAPLLVNYQRALSARKGAPDARLEDFRWMLEELRVALFAQELRTPMPMSVKRLQKAWAALQQ